MVDDGGVRDGGQRPFGRAHIGGEPLDALDLAFRHRAADQPYGVTAAREFAGERGACRAGAQYDVERD
ncbi:hypothetical protein Sliba_03860 [Streptomyces nigrescens]|uniref:Uncharacterized protein n=1 Tax=Streptomyces nigrescens TaxID=1920 RepID=A0A640T868_STRNI|nr:hypothetical protein Sliba_03860 [Streptomyces libani subsp. libani]GGV85282.1 hypothetical protein GCM10010500_01390 [Streptomyces libani subsp. libani]